MNLTVDEVKEFIHEYVKDYPVTKQLHFQVRNSVDELYGDKLSPFYQNAKAAYQAYRFEDDGRFGKIGIVANLNIDVLDLRKSLNHEILGHYGLNTFTPENKKLLLDSIIASKSELAPLWEFVEKNYPKEPLYLKAEEVFCLVVEDIQPEMHRNFPEEEYSLTPLTMESLKNIALAVAAGISDRSRTQQTFLRQDVTHIQYQMHQSDLREAYREQEDDLER